MWNHPFPLPPKMSEEERQKALARARKKLREFQERNNLLPVQPCKKRCVRRASGHHEKSSPSSEDHRPPVEAEEAPTACPLLEHPSVGVPPSGCIPPMSLSSLQHDKELTEERDFLKVELLKNIKSNEELKEVNSELEDKLQISVKEKVTLQNELDDVKKKLEISESLLSQLQMLLNNLQNDRDYYMQKLNEETALWQGKTQCLLEQMEELKADKEKSMDKIQELETVVTELKSQMAVHPSPEPPKGSSEMEQHLQAENRDLKKQLENLATHLQEQLKNNNELNELNLERGCRLAELELQPEICKAQEETRKQTLETMENEHTTVCQAILQNQYPQEQLAEQQDRFIKLTNTPTIEEYTTTNEPTTAFQKVGLVASSHFAVNLVGSMESTVPYMEKTTESHAIQHPQQIQRDPQENPGSGNSLCVPFFYQARKGNQVEILEI